MARARSLVLACLLLSCLAADVLAKRIDSRVGIAAADGGLKAKTKAIYDCPDTPRMSGCAETGCALHMHGKTSTLICAQCKNEKAYVLVNQNTRRAQCECAPGYAGKGQDGVCKKCPAGTDIAEGGPIAKSVCTKCPEGSYVSDDGSDCVCPAGHYRAVAPDQPVGYKKIECKPCAARNAYVADDGHTQASCKMCAPPSVANKDHTKCVTPDSEDAAAEGGLMSSLAHTPLGGLAQAFEEGRQQVQNQRMTNVANGDPPSIKSLASRVRNVFGRRSGNVDDFDLEDDAPKTRSKKAAPAADVEIDQAEVESEADNVAAEAQDNKSKHGHKDSHRESHKDAKHYDSDSDEEYAVGKKEHKHQSKKDSAYEKKEESYDTKEPEHKHHNSKDKESYSKHSEQEDEYKEHKHSSKSDTYDKNDSYTKDKESYSKDVDYKQAHDKKSYYEKRATSQSKTESEPAAELPKTESKPEAQPKADSSKDSAPTKQDPSSTPSNQAPSSSSKPAEPKAEPTPEKKKPLSEQYRRNKPGPTVDTDSKPTGPVKAPPTKADPNIAKTLIPGLAPEQDDDVTPKDAAKSAPKDASKTAPKAEEKKGPMTLRDLAKKVGSAFGATTSPVANPMGNPMGFIDPEALADAGLPPVSNVGQLMGALIKKQMGELDLDEWAGGVKGAQKQI